MIIDNFWVEFLILVLLIILSNYPVYRRNMWISSKKDVLLFIFFILIFIIMPMLGAYFALKIFKHYSLVSVSYCFLILVFPTIYKYVIGKIKNDNIVMLGLFLPSTLAIIVTIFSLSVTQFNASNGIEMKKNDEVSVIDTSFINLKKSFQQVEEVVTFEKGKIQSLLESLSDDIQEKTKEFEGLKAREKELLAQIEHYKQLSSINEKQSEALMRSLNGNKKFDLFIAFILGVFASVVASVITNKRLRRSILSFNNSPDVKHTRSMVGIPVKSVKSRS